MEFFCYHRDRPGSVTLREALLERHWSYMDRYQADMIARGPTLDGDTATGSVHIVDLPDPAAARAMNRLDLRREDPGDQDLFNRILWAMIKGRERPYPGSRRLALHEIQRGY